MSDKYPPGTIKTLLSKYTVVNTDVRKSANGGLAPGNIMVRRSDGKRGRAKRDGHVQRDKRYYTHDLLVEKGSQEGHKSGRDRSHGADSYPPGTIKRLLSKYTVVNTVRLHTV